MNDKLNQLIISITNYIDEVIRLLIPGQKMSYQFYKPFKN
jgi:hypothetical protein